jgi:hypothetical protein
VTDFAFLSSGADITQMRDAGKMELAWYLGIFLPNLLLTIIAKC